ncbi:MAG: hypothetical protein ACR2JC_12250 [Chloroflexota bacterium]|nr:MAG: hypothetical protein DLM70_16210 [Chloroflexota bacterium]
MTDGYIAPPRLLADGGQFMQGDVFKDVPFSCVELDGTVTLASTWAILLTPTWDFALKATHLERQVAPIEPLVESDARPDTWKSSAPPRQLLLLPPLVNHLPEGGIVHFRRAQQIHAHHLQQASRVATLDDNCLRLLLAAHTAYYTRAAINSETIPVATDDPRVLWRVIDEAQAVPGLAARRTALENAIQVAIQATARHHGISAPSPAMALVWLEELARHKAIPVATRKLVRVLGRAQKTLLNLYRVIPANLSQHEAGYRQLIDQLEGVGALLQDPDPKQLTPESLRTAGLANLLRS